MYFYHTFFSDFIWYSATPAETVPQSVQVIFYPTRHKLHRKQKDSGTLGEDGGINPQYKYRKDNICVFKNQKQVTVSLFLFL